MRERKLKEICNPESNVIMEGPTSTPDTKNLAKQSRHTLSTLRNLAKNCNFGALENELIRDWSVEKVATVSDLRC